MALKKTMNLLDNFNHIVVFEDAYIKARHVESTKSAAMVRVSICKSAEDAVLTEHTYEFTPDMDGANFIRQAYLYLKTLPEFANAVDC